jgi:hypothetical protein
MLPASGNIGALFGNGSWQQDNTRSGSFMSNVYYETIDKMEKSGVDKEYINGWAGGFLHNPKREEQRINEAYEAGYNDGSAKKADGFQAWIKK